MADDARGHPAFLLGTYTFTAIDQGRAEIWVYQPLTIIYGTNPFRRIFVIDDYCKVQGSIQVAVWFYVFATREDLVGEITACGHRIVERDHFVALPATGLCNQPVLVLNPGNGRWERTRVLDVGPWFPFNWPTPPPGCQSYPPDPYWNTTGIPRAEEMRGQVRECDPKQLRINGAGIDLADGTFWDGLGMSDNGYILWRFD